MRITKLRNPIVRTKASSAEPYRFPYTGFLALANGLKKRWPPFDKVLLSRRSARDFQEPLSFLQLSQAVWYSSNLREKRYIGKKLVWQSRVSASAGGCHAISIVILKAPKFANEVLIYDPEHNGFGVIDSVDKKLLKLALRETDTCLPTRKGTIFWFLADIAKTATKYEHPESLIWRDSGALLTTILLVAEGLKLEACAIGMHDAPSLRRALSLKSNLIGVGGCVLSAQKRIR